MQKSFIAVLTAFVLVGAGCFPAIPSTPAVPSVPVVPSVPSASAAFGIPVTLSLGQSTTYEGGLNVTLTEINDSRCPADVQCIWAGELAAALVVSGGDLTGEQTVRLGETTAPSATIGSYVFGLAAITTTSVTINVSLCESCDVR